MDDDNYKDLSDSISDYAKEKRIKHSTSLKNKEIIEKNEIKPNEEQIELFKSILRENQNPLEAIVNEFPDSSPVFDSDFLSDIFDSLLTKSEGWLDLFMFLLNSNKENFDNLSSLNLMSDLLMPDIPDSFEVIDELLSFPSESNMMIEHFISLNGFGELVFYSQDDNYKKSISHIFYLIAKNKRIIYDSLFTSERYFQKKKIEEEKKLEHEKEEELEDKTKLSKEINSDSLFLSMFPSPITELNIEQDSTEPDSTAFLQDNSEEISHYPFDFMIQNLMNTGDLDIILNVLHGIKRMFKYNHSSIRVFCDAFIDNYIIPAEEDEINILIFQILQNAYFNDYPIKTEDERFIKVVNEVNSIINSPDVHEKVLLASIDLIKSMIENSTHEIQPLDMFQNTNIFQILCERSPYMNLHLKKATIELFSKVIEYTNAGRLREIVHFGVIGVFCEYSDTNNQEILKLILKNIYWMMNYSFMSDVPEEDLQQLDDFIQNYQEEEITNHDNALIFEKINEIWIKWNENES